MDNVMIVIAIIAGLCWVVSKECAAAVTVNDDPPQPAAEDRRRHHHRRTRILPRPTNNRHQYPKK